VTVSRPSSCTSIVIRRSIELTRTEKCSSMSSAKTRPKKNSVLDGKYPTAEVAFYDDTIGYAEPNLSAQVAQMKQKGVDFVETCMDINEVIVLAKEMQKQGLKAVQQLPNGYDLELIKNNADLLEGSIVIPDKLVHLAAIARILWGIVNDAPGVWIGPDGRPHRVPGGPGDPVFAGLALGLSSGLGMSSPDVAKALRDADLRGRVGNIAERLMSQQIG